MHIHQMQLVYDAREDRLVWKLRTRSGEIYTVGLTRRMVLRLWAPFLRLVGQAGAPALAPQTLLTPAAQAMLVDAARQRPLPTADFSAPFDAQAVREPLGAQPLLADVIDLVPPTSTRGLQIKLRGTDGRALELQLSADLATALLRLLEQALTVSEWLRVPTLAAVPAQAAPPGPLN